MPMPNAIVATTTSTSSRANASWLLARVAALPLLACADPQVRPEERALVAGRLHHAELPHDVAGDGACGSRGEREHGHVELRAQPLESPVRRPEIVSPLADAM